MEWSGLLGDLLNTGGMAATAYLPYSESGEQIDALRAATEQFSSGAAALGQQAASQTQFQPFSVRTTGGTADVGAGGALNLNLSPEQQQLQQSLLQQAQQMAGAGIDPSQYQALQNQAMLQSQQTLGAGLPTASDLFSQMQASMAGENERQRLQLENRLAGQGRLGVQTSMFGGTPDQLAFEKAQQEQMSRNYLQAQQLAPQLAQQQTANAASLFGLGQAAAQAPLGLQAAQLGNIGTAMGTSFMPQQQLLSALTPSAQFANIGASRDIASSEAISRMGLGGLEAEAAGLSAIGQLESGRVNALAEALSGLFNVQAGQESSSIDLLVDQLLGLGG